MPLVFDETFENACRNAEELNKMMNDMTEAARLVPIVKLLQTYIEPITAHRNLKLELDTTKLAFNTITLTTEAFTLYITYEQGHMRTHGDRIYGYGIRNHYTGTLSMGASYKNYAELKEFIESRAIPMFESLP